MLEVGRVVDAGSEDHDVGFGACTCRRGGTQRVKEMSGIVADGAHAMTPKQVGNDLRHRPTVLDYVRDARRATQVVLEHEEASVAIADEVDAGHVDAHAAGRLEPGNRTVEVA